MTYRPAKKKGKSACSRGLHENKEWALQELMNKRPMTTLARGEMLTVRLQGWTLEGSCCDHGGGGLKWREVKVIGLKSGWWMGHPHGEVEHGMEREK